MPSPALRISAASQAAASRTRSSAVGHSWAYVVSVVVDLAWPRARWTATTSQPEAISPDAKKCRRSWSRTPSTPALGQRGPPAVADGVLVGRNALDAGEEPVAAEAQRHVLGEHLDERVGDVGGSLGVVLRKPDLDPPAVEALNLSADVDLSAQEVELWVRIWRRGCDRPRGSTWTIWLNYS